MRLVFKKLNFPHQKQAQSYEGYCFVSLSCFFLYMKEMDDFYDDSIHKIRGRKHTLRILDILRSSAIDDNVLCMIKKKQP